MSKRYKNSPVNEGRWGGHELDSDHCALVRKSSDTLGRGSVPQFDLTYVGIISFAHAVEVFT